MLTATNPEQVLAQLGKAAQAEQDLYKKDALIREYVKLASFIERERARVFLASRQPVTYPGRRKPRPGTGVAHQKRQAAKARNKKGGR